MAKLYGPHYAEIWRAALCLPGHTDLADSLAQEYADYRSISLSAARERLEESWRSHHQRRRQVFPADLEPEKLRRYYDANEELGMEIGLNWHSLRTDPWALHSVAGLHAVQQMSDAASVFEFGHGIGSTGILFARHGFEVTLGDISHAYREFTRYRFQRRGLKATFVDLTSTAPQPEAYDAMVSFDVLEHIRNPLPAIRAMHAGLRSGALMVLNIAFGRDPDNPEHLLTWRTGVLDRIRAVGFDRVRSASLLVYYKRELGGPRRVLYRVQDLADALVEDSCARIPGLRRLVRPYTAPPVGN